MCTYKHYIELIISNTILILLALCPVCLDMHINDKANNLTSLFLFQAADRRYLSCPGNFTVSHLKKFIKMKFNLSGRFQVG